MYKGFLNKYITSQQKSELADIWVLDQRMKDILQLKKITRPNIFLCKFNENIYAHLGTSITCMAAEPH